MLIGCHLVACRTLVFGLLLVSCSYLVHAPVLITNNEIFGVRVGY